ncbi:Peroxin-29 [Hyphodiscus hymeniophilus]|uniref:Peroxin-29 n=1 Tax=Hyphodiscus hymeniophilus TaxID=353542 RepID=A0A9P6VR45_9HELO|nr:Peroxin-29 [Hyphodiscus hymeniophilus]
MDEFTVDAFVNRDEPIPVVSLDRHDDISEEEEEYDGTQPERKRDVFRRHAANMKENVRKVQGKATEHGSSMQDRFLEKLLQQVIPIEDLSSNKDHGPIQDSFAERPSFNITTMSANFRRFNARIGVVFVFQSKVIRLLSWKHTSHTLSFLAIYTFVCLDPYLLSVLPLAVLLLALLIPSFIARHPAAPTTVLSNPNFAYTPTGPALAPAPTVKPVKELSKDFFRNMRDLQNSMEDFSQLHDKVLTVFTPPTNFSDEALSSTLFLFTFATAGFMFIASHLMPWRLIFLIMGWVATGLGHPTIQRQMQNTHQTHVAPHEEQAKSYLTSWIDKDIMLDSAPELREVEIFELQHLSRSSGEWEAWLFTPLPYDPLSMERVRGERPKGTRFFEDVAAPRGWEWSEKKWALDLWSREWVEERIITGVEVETEGERWVYDINYEYGIEDLDDLGDGSRTPVKRKGKEQRRPVPSWEEGSDVEIGESRRRGSQRIHFI